MEGYEYEEADEWEDNFEDAAAKNTTSWIGK